MILLNNDQKWNIELIRRTAVHLESKQHFV